MKITGTKKLIILLLSLVCAVAVGLGWGIFSGQDALAATASSDTDAENSKPTEDVQPNVEDISEDYYDEALLREVASMTEIDYDLVNFYARSHEANAGLMLADTKKDVEGVKQELATFLKDYSSGVLVNENPEIEDEDWYVAPDEVSKYVYTDPVGLGSIWSNYFTSKSFVTKESQYWGLNGFTIGNYEHLQNNAYGGTPADKSFIYTWAWLNEGEEYKFGMTSSCTYSSVVVGAMNASSFFSTYLRGFWFNSTTGIADATDTTRNPDGSRKTLADYQREYATDIEPSNAHIKITSGGKGGGKIQATVSADAPSGVYYIQFTDPYNNRSVYRFSNKGLYESNLGGWDSWGWATSSSHLNGSYPTHWSYYMRYVVIIHREGITAPTVEFESGVSNDLMSKTTDRKSVV